MANTHQIAHRVDPEARVVYIDIDPMVSTHASARMAGANVVTLRADLRDPDQVLSDPQVRDTLDFSQPVGIMFACVPCTACGTKKTRGRSCGSSGTRCRRAATWP